jgi:hypothetical protein
MDPITFLSRYKITKFPQADNSPDRQSVQSASPGNVSTFPTILAPLSQTIHQSLLSRYAKRHPVNQAISSQTKLPVPLPVLKNPLPTTPYLTDKADGIHDLTNGQHDHTKIIPRQLVTRKDLQLFKEDFKRKLLTAIKGLIQDQPRAPV